MSVSPRDGMWGHVAGQSPDPPGVLTAPERLIESLNEADADRLCHDSQALTRIAWFGAASPCLVPFLARHPRLLVRLFLEGEVKSGYLGPQGPGGAETFLAECKASQDPEALARHVAVFRNSHMVRLYSQEVLGLRPPPEVWAEWSEVAALCIQGAMGGVKGLLPGKEKGVRVAVMGMGKLGGRELSYKSDLDIMFVYDDARSWRPPKGVVVSEQLTRVAQRCLSRMAMPMREGPGCAVAAVRDPRTIDGVASSV